MPGHVVPTHNTCSYNNRGFDRLRLHYMGASSSRMRLATPDGPSQRITRSFLLCPPPLRLPRAPYPLVPPVRPRVTDSVAAVVVAVHCFAAAALVLLLWAVAQCCQTDVGLGGASYHS